MILNLEIDLKKLIKKGQNFEAVVLFILKLFYIKKRIFGQYVEITARPKSAWSRMQARFKTRKRS